MSWLTNTFSTSIGKKILMSLTGLFLCSFLLVHLSGNLQLFYKDHGLAFNEYAVFMTTNPFIKTISYGLYATILFHAVLGLALVFENKKSRPVQYDTYKGNANSHWTSRSMGLLGMIVLLFITFHMKDFWWEYKFTTEIPMVEYRKDLATGAIDKQPFNGTINGKMEQYTIEENNMPKTEVTIVKDLYEEVEEAFKSPLVSILYIISMLAIAFHLFHGFKSAFQTLGINHKVWNPVIKTVGIGLFAIIIPALFAALPAYFWLIK